MKNRLKKWFFLALILCFVAVGIPGDTVTPGLQKELLLGDIISGERFGLARWEIEAVTEKGKGMVTRPEASMGVLQAHDLVIRYMSDARRIGELEGSIVELYARGAPEDLAKARSLQSELDALRKVQKERRPTVERILQRQISSVMEEEKLGLFGKALPPVSFHFTTTPKYLVISPRDRIVMIKGITLKPDIPVARQEEIEDEIFQKLNESALVDALGGFSTYPTMVTDQADLLWILSTIAHEWTHIYLAFHPLGWHYFSSQEMHTINETVADIVGNEIGMETLRRYYPEMVPHRLPPWVPPPPKPRFDFNKEMRETYLHTVELLKGGKIEEAEAYMEERRKIFVAHGYAIRKLNQAYFAFHGSYAAGPSAMSPLGPELRQIRALSPSLRYFLRTVASFSSPQDLSEALWRLRNRTEACAPSGGLGVPFVGALWHGAADGAPGRSAYCR